MKLETVYIERVTATGPMSEADKVLEWLHSRGYRTIRTGPRRVGLTKVDPNQYQIVGEREIDPPIEPYSPPEGWSERAAQPAAEPQTGAE